MSLQAMMTLNICLESYGAAVHVFDALIGVSTERAHQPIHTWRGRRVVGVLRPATSFDTPVRSFAEQVRHATERLPIEQAHALWLVDVCGCSYEQAASEAGTSRSSMSCRVSLGRRAIRAAVATEPAAATVS